MKQKFTFLATAFFAAALALSAQSPVELDQHLNCGTDQAMEHLFLQDPALRAAHNQSQQQAEEQDRLDFQNGYREGDSRSMPPVYVIPVVFHIIHNYGTENISDAQVLDAMRLINEDFRKQNADTSLIVPTFQGIAADCEIEFRLANKDPNGNCTNGIERIVSTETYIGDDDSKLNPWPRNKYLNIWVCAQVTTYDINGNPVTGAAAAYAYLPGTASNSSMAPVDGIISLSTYIGSIGTSASTHAHTISHEIGHYLNLQHVWGGSNSPGVQCGNDGVTDTPETMGWTTCNLTSNDVCNPGAEENVQNFMDYSYCSRMFTAGQKIRMRNALTSSTAQRNQLWTAANLLATGTDSNPVVCAPFSDFYPVNKITVCAGGSVSFNDLCWNGTPTSWNWTFPGGTPSSSTASTPTVTYNTPGVYDVTLTAGNSAGSNTRTRTAHVTVLPVTAQFNDWHFVEGMENATSFSSDWSFGTGSWARTTTTAFTGSASARVNNYNMTAGVVSELYSPTIDLSAIQNPSFTFRLAYARKAIGDADKLRIYASTDCGQTWTMKYIKTGSTLSTISGTVTSNFVPTSSEWRLETVNLGAVVNASNVRFKFEFTSDGGNNIYIDDINISAPTGVSSPEAGVQHFDVYPNPAPENSTVAFSLEQQQEINLQLVDMTGREVLSVYKGNLSAGQHNLPLNTESLGAGVYFVRLVTEEGRAVTQKLIVQ
jgi:PKD repeat protein